MAPPVDLYFFIGSLYSYLAIQRVGAAAARAGVALRWRPFNLRAIMIEQKNIPRSNPVKMRYIWRDVERRALRHGIAFPKAPPYPVDADALANRVAVVAAGEGWCADYAVAAYRNWFTQQRDPGDLASLALTLRALGRDPDAIVARANGEEIRVRFDAETEAARQLGIFGAPTFAVGGEIFWGDDRLEEALDWARMPQD